MIPTELFPEVWHLKFRTPFGKVADFFHGWMAKQPEPGIPFLRLPGGAGGSNEDSWHGTRSGVHTPLSLNALNAFGICVSWFWDEYAKYDWY